MNVPTIIIIPDLECGEYAGGGAGMTQADIGAGGGCEFRRWIRGRREWIGAVFEEYERFCGVAVTLASSLASDSQTV